MGGRACVMLSRMHFARSRTNAHHIIYWAEHARGSLFAMFGHPHSLMGHKCVKGVDLRTSKSYVRCASCVQKLSICICCIIYA